MLLNALRTRLAFPRASFQMCLLAIVAGCSAASVIVVFRMMFENLQLLWLESPDQFDQLDGHSRLLLPIGAVLIILAFARLTGLKYYRMGVPYVIHRVKRHYGNIPLPTFLNQFFGGVIALAAGFGVGKEGPSVHLGAASSGFIGYWLKLPLNSIRILAGCGIAAGISACFNTPFAAVIFVMEVVLREYKIHIFIPIMLAAACGSLITKLAFGDHSALDFLTFVPLQAWIYWYLVPCGMILGLVAALFNRQLMWMMRSFGQLSMTKRLLIAGAATGCLGWIFPQAMGAGLAPLSPVIDSPSNIAFVVLLLLAKMLMTTIAISLGVPGGIIGPVFGFGVLAGIILLYPLLIIAPELADTNGSFALLGMAGMLAAVLHAPLSALSAVMELSLTPEVILPAMLVIVPAYVTSVQWLKNRSIFLQQLDHQKLPYTLSPLRETLQRHGVLSAVNKVFQTVDNTTEEDHLAILKAHPKTTLIVKPYHTEMDYRWVDFNHDLHEANQHKVIYYPLAGISHQSTMAEAYELLQAKRQGAVYIYGEHKHQIIGIVNWNTIRSFLTQERY